MLQILGGAELGGSSEEIADLIAEGAVVGMFHDGHDLNGVVTQSLDPGQGLFFEFLIGADLALFLGHADVAFVDEEVLVRLEVAVSPDELFLGSMDHSGPADVLGILNHILGVGGDPVQILAVMYHDAADALTVLQCVPAGEENFPHAIIQLLHGVASAVPEVEVAGEVHGFSGGGPLAIVPAVVGAVEAVEHVAVGEFPEGLALLQKALSGIFKVAHPQLQVALKGLQHGIIFQNLQGHKISILSKNESFIMGGRYAFILLRESRFVKNDKEKVRNFTNL